MSDAFTCTVDGQPQEARAGETILDVTGRAGRAVPTLCHDPRLDPAGACRSCLVEIEGQRRLQPACLFKVTPGMVINTDSERIRRHRQVLMSLYVADLPGGAAPAVRDLAGGAEPLALAPVEAPRIGRPHDANPYVGFDPDKCILCARCTRYCDEVEAVSAIALTDRGSETSIGTLGNRGLLDTTCELCGGCIDTCPTGAMFEKKAPAIPDAQLERVRSTCNFCGVGCQLDLNVAGGRVVKVTSPPPGETLNDGNLCVKGRFAYDFIHHEERLTHPLVREDGQLRRATWEEAIARAAEGLLGVAARHGADALGFISSSRCTGEENYLVQKLSRAAFGTNNCHQCAAT